MYQRLAVFVLSVLRTPTGVEHRRRDQWGKYKRSFCSDTGAGSSAGVSWRALHAPCTHRVKLCQFAWTLLFDPYWAQCHSVVARCVVVGCVQSPFPFFRVFLRPLFRVTPPPPLEVSLSMLNDGATPQPH